MSRFPIRRLLQNERAAAVIEMAMVAPVLALGVIELRQQTMHPLQSELDLSRMQRGQPRDQLVKGRSAVRRSAALADGATAGAASVSTTVLAGGGSCGARSGRSRA